MEAQLCADGAVRLFEDGGGLEELAVLFHQKRLLIRELTVKGDTLEQYFLSVIGGEGHGKLA